MVNLQNIIELKSYINTHIIPNGMREIDGEEMNNVVNTLATFIGTYSLNVPLIDVQSGSGPFAVQHPITVFTGNPSSITVPGNLPNIYVFLNATGVDIPFNTSFTYFDLYGTELNFIPLRQSLWLGKSENSSWIQINNLTGSGGGTGAGLPSQAGNAGSVLFTNGTSAFWGESHRTYISSDFSNATDLPISGLQYQKVSVYFSAAANYIYEQNGEWEYLPGRTGIKILIPGFDSTAYNYFFEIYLKPLNA